MNGNETFLANPDFICREVAGEIILVPTGNTAGDFNGLATLNGTGAFLWKLLRKERTLSELGKILAEKYGLGEKQGLADATEFILMAQEKQAVLSVIHCEKQFNIDQ